MSRLSGRWRTFWRLFGTFSTLSLLAIACLGWLVLQRVEAARLLQIEDSLHTDAILIEKLLGEVPLARQPQLFRELKGLPGSEEGLRITLLNKQGVVLTDSAEDPAALDNHSDRPEVVAAWKSGTGTSIRYSHSLSQEMMYAARRTPNTGDVCIVRVSRPLASIASELNDLRQTVWSIAAATAVAVLVLAFVLARRITRPLRDLTAGAEQIAAGDYGHKVDAVRADEFGIVARAFNTMSERLAQQFRQVQEDRQQLRTVLSGMVEGVIAIDAEQRILFANDRAGELLEFPTESAIGLKLWEVVRQRAFHDAVERARNSPEHNREEIDWNGPTVRSLAVYVGSLAGPLPAGAILVLQDTTELRRLERLRQDFVANVSHELKTPLSVIKVCVETLLDGAIEDVEHRSSFLEQIEDQANRLHMLILDLLSLARIESGEEAFELTAVSLEAAVRDCVERQGARAEAKQQVLQACGPEQRVGSQESGVRSQESGVRSRELGVGTQESSQDVLLPPVVAWADEEAVAQILDNLVDNAVKYTPEGGQIQVRWYANDGQVCLEVEDSGIGIPERDLPRIFERFYRVDKARSREMGGTGLGLSIVKHLAQALQGSVTASSRLHHGTKFTIRLPRAPAT
jgi:two-component system, OmpR family, phosphate regulon sensor histidine kinase PhoR